MPATVSLPVLLTGFLVGVGFVYSQPRYEGALDSDTDPWSSVDTGPEWEKDPIIGSVFAEGAGFPPKAVCKAIVLDSQHALSAAHCVAMNRLRSLTLVLSDSDVYLSNVIGISGVTLHPEFLLSASESAPAHDLVVLTLARRVPLGSSAQDMSFAPPVVGEDVALGGLGEWPVASRPTYSVGRVQTVGAVEFRLSARSVPRPCYGDSGSPAFSQAHPHGLIGILSRAAVDSDTQCSKGALFTRIDVNADWLARTLKNDSPPP
jgi:Trypsin